MYNTRFTTLLVILAAAGTIACEDDPAVVTDPDVSSSFAISTTNATGMGPFLLEMPRDEGEPSLRGCAQAVNDEGMISGWTVVGVPGQGGSTINALTVWDRKFKPTLPGWSIPTLEFAVVDMNNRGQVLALVGDPAFALPDDVLLIDPDGTVETPVPSYSFGSFLSVYPIRMDRAGNVMVSYLRNDCLSTPYPCTEEVAWIEVTGRGKLEPSHEDPWGAWDGPAECLGEAMDDNGTVYGQCYIEGNKVHFRWPSGYGPEVYPPNAIDLVNGGIVDVNRYGEVIGGDDLGAVFWSPSTGRVQIPQLPTISLYPIGLNDRGVVLLSGEYWDGTNRPSPRVGYWTRIGGTKVLPRNGWPHVEVHDINNQGVIVGCVGGDGSKELVPAYWRVQ